jgi:predicted MPP superfamily phosphohydrolase
VTFWFRALAAGMALGIPLYAWATRGRIYSIFTVLILAIALPGAVVMHARYLELVSPRLGLVLEAAFLWAMLAAGLHLASLVTARLRSPAFRWGVSIPGMVFLAAGALSGAWLLALVPLRLLFDGLGIDLGIAALRWLDLLPFAIALASVATSLRPKDEIVRMVPSSASPDAVTRLPIERYRTGRREPPPLERRPLRIVQIADPHLGPWQSVAQLRRVIDDLLRHEPDLVLLTGDFLTMEGSGTRGALTAALAPLQRVRGRAYAVFGNHDHDHGAPAEVHAALAANGVHVLMDAEVAIATAAGPVQIVGADYVGKGRREHIQQLLQAHPRRAGHLRLLLLHDPSIFRHIPPGEVDLTLSGHTHGGQLGLVSFGLDWTVLSRTGWPDHGLFGHGSNRLYVHRGTGFYGFPLRIGVPGEASLLEVVMECGDGLQLAG